MLRSVKQYFADVIKGGIELLFPPLCFNCNEKLTDDEKVICTKCWLEIALLPDHILSKKHKGEYIDQLDSLWLFDETFQKIVHLLKYSNCRSIGMQIGCFMGNYLKENSLADLENSVLVPVPLHPVKKRERGYNQAELIANGISEVTGIDVNTNLVTRVKNTATQTKMNRKERIENMKDAFAAVGKTDNKTVIIIDDVYTTGTTINSVAEEIRRNNKAITTVAFSAAMPE
ncbi:MAG: ComF family protein [Fidelibacterota bacterium]